MLNVFYAALLILCVGGFLALVLMKKNALAHRVGSITAIIGSALALISGVGTLLARQTLSASMSTSFPLLRIQLHIDWLAALFISIIATVSLLTSIYGIGYMKKYYSEYNMPRIYLDAASGRTQPIPFC